MAIKRKPGRPRKYPIKEAQAPDIPTKKDLREHLKSQGIKLRPVPKQDLFRPRSQEKKSQVERLAEGAISTPSEKTLDVSFIQAIIEASNKNNVSSISCFGIRISFHTPTTVGKKAVEGLSHGFGAETLNTRVRSETQDREVFQTPEDRELAEDTRLAQLMTDDPSAYEAEVIDRQLNTSPAAGHEQNARRTQQDLYPS